MTPRHCTTCGETLRSEDYTPTETQCGACANEEDDAPRTRLEWIEATHDENDYPQSQRPDPDAQAFHLALSALLAEHSLFHAPQKAYDSWYDSMRADTCKSCGQKLSGCCK